MPRKRNHKNRNLLKTYPKGISIEASANISHEEDKLPSFTMVANTGTPMFPKGSKDVPIVVDIKGAYTKNKIIPILLEHDPTKIVGHGEMETTENSINASGIISGTGEAAEEVVSSSKNGFPWQATIGAKIEKYHLVPKGKKAFVNNRFHHGPLIVASRSEVYEISFTPVGADRDTSAQIAATQSTSYGELKEMNEFDKWLQDNEIEASEISENQLNNYKKIFDNLQASNSSDTDPPTEPLVEDGDEGDEGDDVDIKASLRIEAAAELNRINGIAKATSDFSDLEGISDLQASAVESGISVSDYELSLWKKQAKQNSKKVNTLAIHASGEEVDNDVLTAALCLNSDPNCIKTLEASYGSKAEEILNKASDKNVRSMSIHRIADMTIQAAGMSTGHQYNRDNDWIRKFKEADSKIQAAGAFSTVSISNIMTDAQNKFLLDSFGGSGGVGALETIASISSATDFKTNNSYRVTGKGEFTEVGANGEIKALSISDDAFTNSLNTYAGKLGLNRQQLINDDLGALSLAPRMFGRMARMKLNRVGWVAFLDNSTFFTAARGNYFEGAATNLQISSLQTAYEKSMLLKDDNDDPIDIVFDILLVGPENANLANQLFDDSSVAITTTADTAKMQSNPHQGKYTPLATPWLSTGFGVKNSSGTELGSTTHWYLLTSEKDFAPIDIVYLNGVRNPTVELEQTPPDVLGVQWISYFDFGVSQKEYRGGIKSKGAA